MKKIMHKAAIFCAGFFSLALFVLGNTNTSGIYYQAKTPAGMDRFKKI